ncbi:hypothetical protein Maes01_01263 [Microbulbifer aestuariivivens]|uniref:AraC family transcriptional regulator n=1 Tax=Microbulbifer aestuariivivens TaxID=1908308 RepID=A0ABP9WQK5_9GAMM
MLRVLKFALLMLWTSFAFAQSVSRDEIRGLDDQIQDAKEDVIELTAELARLEEKLLFPSNTQAAFFVSIPKASNFDLESVELKLNNEVVAHHLYTYREIEALRKGGVQKIYVANVQSGSHPLQVSFLGKSAGGQALSATASHTVEKRVGPKFVEITIAGEQSAISFKDW